MGLFRRVFNDAVNGIRYVPIKQAFRSEFNEFVRMSDELGRAAPREEDLYPITNEKTAATGFDPHYLYHVAWGARVLARTKPEKHVDISSSLNFCTTVSAFVPVEFYDYRPADVRLEGLDCRKGDLMALPFSDGSLRSLSCLHVIEHIGLGRYGDSLDPNGDIKACRELERVLSPGGNLLIAVPVGRPKVAFNAHRVYSFEQARGLFSELKLVDFALIPDEQPDKGIISDAPPELVDEQEYGCGCFWFRKR
mgnify:CR=1 FL=1|jgi:SAM-dependent methyltransferase